MMKRQSVSQRPSHPRRLLALAAVLVIAAALWWIREEQEPAPVDPPMQPRNAGNAYEPERATSPAPPELAPRIVEPIAGEAEPSALPAPVIHPERSLGELERQFLAIRDKEEQIDLLGEIAGHNDGAAVQTLVRIFPLARDAELKESILARLADIDPEAAPAARIALLESALRGQARNVRLTALGLLGDSDDPRALTALRRAARDGSDKMLREAAAAIVKAVEESER